MDEKLKRTLVQAALEARVGSVILAKSGKVFSGSNIENASYGLSSCAERNTIFKVVTEGEKDFVMLAVVTKDGGFSCGTCRQVMNEFNPKLLVIVANDKGEILYEKLFSNYCHMDLARTICNKVLPNESCMHYNTNSCAKWVPSI